MIKHMSLILTALSLFSFYGCTGLSSFYKVQEQHLANIDKKIQELEQSLSSLNSSDQNLEKRIEELSQGTADIHTNYSKLNDKLDGFSSEVKAKGESLETTISDTQKNIADLMAKLSEIEKAKTDLQNQIVVLQSQRSRTLSSHIEQQNETIKKEAKEMIEQGREMVEEAKSGQKIDETDKEIETLVVNQQKEALQKLLEDALTLYRNGSYKEAISKWEEVLVIDPENLEAKFNIEIAKEKIKIVSEK